MKSVLIHPIAYREIDQAVAYYRVIDRELSDSLLSLVDEAMTTISDRPGIGVRHGDTPYRRYVLRRFPYVIFYREEPEAIWIVAVAHGRQKPDYWIDREDGGG